MQNVETSKTVSIWHGTTVGPQSLGVLRDVYTIVESKVQGSS